MLLVASAANAQPTEADQNAKKALIGVGIKTGLGMYRMVASDLELSRELRKIDPNAHGASLKRAAVAYEGRVRIGMAGADVLQASTEVVSIGLTYAAASGAGTVPAVMVKAAWDYGTNALIGEMRRDVYERSGTVLARDIKLWQEKSGRTLDEFKALSPEVQVSELVAQQGDLAALRDTLKDDPLGATLAQEATIAHLQAFDQDSLERHARHDVDIAGLKTSVGKLSEGIKLLDDRTSALEGAFNVLDGRVHALEGAVVSLSDDVAKNRIATGAVAAIVYESATAPQKRALLQSGALGPLSDSQRETLSKVIDAQEAREKIASTASSLANGVSAVVGLAGALGIPVSEDLGRAAHFAVGAANTVAAFASGNYIGGIMQLSGVFGKPSSPMDAITPYLRAIDAKLTRVLENQQEILRGISRIEHQIADLRRVVDARFDRVDYQLAVITYGVSNLKLQKFTPCQSAWQDALPDFPSDALAPIDHFATWSDIRAFHQESGVDARECARVLRLTAADLAGASLADDFRLSYIRAENTHDQPLIVNSLGAGPAVTATALQSTELYYKNLERFTRPWRKYHYGSLRNAYVAGAVPIFTLPEALALHRRSSSSPEIQLPLSSADQRFTRLLKLSDAASTQERRASDLLSVPRNSDLALQFAQWTTVVAPYVEWIRDGANLAKPEDFFCHEVARERLARCLDAIPTAGRRGIVDALMVLDSVVAQFNHLMGPSTAMAMAVALQDEKQVATALAFLAENPYLARNTARVLLWCAGAQRLDECGTKKIGLTGYAFVHDQLAIRTPFSDVTFNHLFNNSVSSVSLPDPSLPESPRGLAAVDMSAPVTRCSVPALSPASKDGTGCGTGEGMSIEWVVPGDATPPVVNKQNLQVPLPTSKDYITQAFTYPAVFYDIVHARAQLALRLADYDALSAMPNEADRWAVLNEIRRQQRNEPIEAAGAATL